MHSFTVDAARNLPGPPWLARRRAAAAESFAASPAPTTAEEEWRYSAIADLDLAAYSLANGTRTADAQPPISAPEPDHGGGYEPDARPVPGEARSVEFSLDLASGSDAVSALAVLDVVDGRLVTIDGADSLAAVGVYVGPLTGAADGEAALGSVCDDASDYFSVLNDAFAPAPVLVDVPSGAALDGAIVVRCRAHQTGAASFPRLVVRVGPGAQATVLDVHDSAGPALVAPVVELDVGPAARLGYLNLQQHGRGTWQIASHTARVERDATLVVASVALGGGYARTRTDTRLVGRGASGDLLSAYFGSGDQILDFRTYQDHAAPDTTSNLLYKGAVGDSARSVYTGLIRVRPDARGTNAYQTNRNLKLGDDAWAESVPNLEIENNDVRCSHASAVGPVDPDQVFYLESRGVPTAVAERLIVAGFFAEVVEALPVRAVTETVRRALVAKLNDVLGGTEAIHSHSQGTERQR